MKVAVFGTDKNAIEIKELLIKYGYSVVFFTENRLYNLIGDVISNTEVISIYKLKELIDEKVLDGVIISTEYHRGTVIDIIKECIELGIPKQNIYVVPVNVSRSGGAGEDGLFMQYEDIRQIWCLDYHIVDHCNLKCECCSHSSAYVKDEVFLEPEIYEKDINRMTELIPNLFHLNIIGGEPLLHPDLSKFITIARDAYPYAKIHLVTNGIILNKMSEETIELIRGKNVQVEVSLYPPYHHLLDSFLLFFETNCIKGNIQKITKFDRKYSEKPIFIPEKQVKYCGHCTGLKRGKISRCIDALYIEHLNKRFETELPEEKGIDIYDPELTGQALIKKLEEPMRLCAYCANQYGFLDQTEWRVTNQNSTREDAFFHIPREFSDFL